MEKYGTDKPDLRADKNDKDLLAFAWTVDFPMFEKGMMASGHLRTIHFQRLNRNPWMI